MTTPLATDLTARQTIILVLPRAEYIREYAPLMHALGAVPEIDTLVVTSPGVPALETPRSRVTYHRCPFYLNGSGRSGAYEWVRLLLRREWSARRLLATVKRPAAMVVPSDVADAMLPFVEGARRRGVPVAYVQGAVVFPDYPQLNARMYAERLQGSTIGRKSLLAFMSVVLKVCGIHATVEAKDVLGSRSERVLLMSNSQLEVHRRAGVPADRIRVTGAPFVDRLMTLQHRFDASARERLRQELGLSAGPVALFLTKTRFRLSPTGSREIHETVIRDVVTAIRRELPTWRCILKLHPNEAIEDYKWLSHANDPFVTIIKDHPVEELLLLSDVTLSLGTSSPAFTAAILGCPLILVNLTAAPMLEAHGDFVAAAKTVRSVSELSVVLRQIDDDPETIARLRVPSVVDDVWADGRASERIVDHLRELAHRKVAAS